MLASYNVIHGPAFTRQYDSNGEKHLLNLLIIKLYYIQTDN